jgi:myeloblastin
MRTALLLLLLAGTVAAGHRDVDTPDEAYIDAGREWRHVTCEVSGEERRGLRAKGSGVAIAPEWVLTAAHVLEDAPRDVRVRFDDGSVRRATRLVQHPEFRRDAVGVNDIALVQVEPMPIGEFPAIAECLAGEPMQVVGFGMHGRLDGGELEHDGRLRAGRAIADEWQGTCVVCVAKRGRCRLLYCPASGDSGGPLFNDAGNLVGIHSFTARPAGVRRGQYGEESHHTYVARYAAWIHGVMEGDQ